MNMNFKRKLPIPMEIKEMYPLSDASAKIKAANDEEIKKVFAGESDKLVLVIGPCSADREDAVLDYISRLRRVQEEVKDKITEYHTHTRLIFALENMHNLANNGRVNPIVAKMAGILGIRAIGRASEEGTLEMICKSRGPVNAANDILTNMVGDGYNGGRVKIHHAS